MVVILLAILIWYFSTYNKLIRLKSQYEDAISTIDVYLKKRFDLIPNLVETVKAYAGLRHSFIRNGFIFQSYCVLRHIARFGNF